MQTPVQVDKSHYNFSKYTTKRRWVSLWHQISILNSLEARNVLELGPGSGILKNTCSLYDINVKTVDIDEALSPDFVGSLEDLNFSNDSFDVTCAFQVLEHLPFEAAMKTLFELSRISTKATVISLPDCRTRYPVSIRTPKFGSFEFSYPNLMKSMFPKKHLFDGQHYWEIGAKQYKLEFVLAQMKDATNRSVTNNFRLQEFPYHHFFVLEKRNINA